MMKKLAGDLSPPLKTSKPNIGFKRTGDFNSANRLLQHKSKFPILGGYNRVLREFSKIGYPIDG